MIDVAISSCGRVDILENAVTTFLKHAKSKEGFRLVICEDKVEDPKRQELGREWIENHKELFDEVIYSDTKLTYVYCFSEILKHIRSPYFFRLEDDVVFHEGIDVDKIIEFMKDNDEVISQIIFKRLENHAPLNPVGIENCTGRKIQTVTSYSIATGVFNLEWTNKIVGLSGNGQCHEYGVLMPAMHKLGAKSSILYGDSSEHALDCVGDSLGYKKGAWK